LLARFRFSDVGSTKPKVHSRITLEAPTAARRGEGVTERRHSGPPPIIELPESPGPHPGVVLGAEAYGINPFILDVQRRLVESGYATALPDYYHGHGPKNVEAYDDFSEVLEYMSSLDFTCGARDLAASIDELRNTPGVDAARVCVWGYCTGATLAWLAACLRGDIAAAVLFFPSQPTFPELGPRRPVQPIDLLWQLTCPTLFIYGDSDPVMPPELINDIRARIQIWGIESELRLYPDAGHAFSVPAGPMKNEHAYRAAWKDAIDFLQAHT
jgi:carboxymethylenebutenolidase